MTTSFKGAARRLTDTDLPRVGAIIGVGEDVLHAVMDVEAPKSGFDAQDRPRILFEPHIFYRELGPGPRRDRAVREGLAYPNWKSGAYGPEADQYDKLARAIEIDRAAALRSCSWGRGQIMGFNHKLVGFDSVDAMVAAFMASEAAQIEAIVRFAAANKLDGALRAIDRMARSMPNDWRSFAKGYNGSGYEKNGYHTKLSERFNWWRNIPDTPWTFEALPEAPAAPSKPVPTLTEELPTAEPFWPALWAAFLSLFKGK